MNTLLLYCVQLMNKHMLAVEDYIKTASKKDAVVGVAVVVGLVVLILLVVLIIQLTKPKPVVYQYPPVNACSLLSADEAKELLGDQVIPSKAQAPVASGNTVATKCSFTDMNPDQNSMKIAAVAVRSGINDKGVQQNRAEFAIAKSGKNVEAVESVGDSAFFNPTLGQLNLLNGYDWIILSYGIGESPQENTLDNAKALADKVLASTPELPTF